MTTPSRKDSPYDVEMLLDALVESYQGPETINNLGTYALPNRRAVIEAFQHLQQLLFLGFFSTRRLEPSTLRMALAEHLLPARELLAEQIKRACAWNDRALPPEQHHPPGWCINTTDRLLSQLPKLRRVLYEDILAAYHNDPAAASIEEVVFSYPGVFAITAHRVAHALHQEGVSMIPRILSEYAHTRTGIDIHPGAQIGRRFFIDHGTGLVIGATSIIGDDVKLYQGVTLGALSVGADTPKDIDERIKRHPTLEDRVTVYAGSTILGGDTIIGEDSVIGGNVWLIRSVPARSKIYHKPQNA